MQLITCHLYGSDGHVRPFRILSNLAGGLSTYLRLRGGGGGYSPLNTRRCTNVESTCVVRRCVHGRGYSATTAVQGFQ